MENINLNSEQAYAAMYEFLCMLYEESKSDELGALLGSMSALPDGSIVDPAIEERWNLSLNKALAEKIDTTLKLKR